MVAALSDYCRAAGLKNSTESHGPRTGFTGESYKLIQEERNIPKDSTSHRAAKGQLPAGPIVGFCSREGSLPLTALSSYGAMEWPLSQDSAGRVFR